MDRLTPREAYRRWAPHYGETPLSALDNMLASEMAPAGDQVLLDAGCGTGLRLAGLETRRAFGIDASHEMLAAGGRASVAAADVRALPFADGAFDLVWCRLVLGYLPDIAPAYREFARVCCVGGQVFVSDLHTDAAAAGHKRGFQDAQGRFQEIEAYVHDAAHHLAVAEAVGLELVDVRDAGVGARIREFYVRAGRLDKYEKDEGLNLVCAFLFRRCAA